MADLKSSDTRCVLCLDQKRSPVRIQCGHSFCRECFDIYKTYQKYDWANKCPICRGTLKEPKRAVKRKYSNANMPEDNPVLSETENQNQADSVEHVSILEEFMALAAGYEMQNINSNRYDDNDDEYDDSIEVDGITDDEEYDEFDGYFDSDYYDAHYQVGDNNPFDFSTESENEDNNYYQFDDDFSTNTDHSQEDNEFYNTLAEAQDSPITQQQQQQQQYQQAQQYIFTDYNNNNTIIASSSTDDNHVDWDETIANEIILIDYT